MSIEIGNKTIVDLVDEVVERVQKIIDVYWLEDPHTDDTRKPVAYAQSLPDVQYQGEETLPAVLVFFRGAKGPPADRSARASAEIQVWFGVYGDHTDKRGWAISLDIAQRVFQDFIQRQIMGGFKMHPEPEIIVPDAEPHPYYYAAISTVWDIPMSWETQSIPAFETIHYKEHSFDDCSQGDDLRTMTQMGDIPYKP